MELASSETRKFDEFQHGVLRLYGAKKEEELDALLSYEFGPAYSDYRASWTTAGRSSNFTFPIHLDFELNDSCNQACVMCPRNTNSHPNTGYSLGTKKRFDLDVFERIMQEGRDHGLKSINLGAYAEPLTHPKFFDFTEMAAAYGVIDIRMITNGILLTPERADKLLESSVTNIFISIDAATRETYSSIRGSGYDSVVTNIEYLLSRRQENSAQIPLVRVSFVNMRTNQSELDDFLAQWHNKVDFIDVQPGEDLSINPTHASPVNNDRRIQCISPWQRLSILANGDIIPCCSFYGRYIPIGNINSTSISEAWNGISMADVRANLFNGTSNVCEVCQSSSLL